MPLHNYTIADLIYFFMHRSPWSFKCRSVFHVLLLWEFCISKLSFGSSLLTGCYDMMVLQGVHQTVLRLFCLTMFKKLHTWCLFMKSVCSLAAVNTVADKLQRRKLGAIFFDADITGSLLLLHLFLISSLAGSKCQSSDACTLSSVKFLKQWVIPCLAV
jgi:hypothetical protein